MDETGQLFTALKKLKIVSVDPTSSFDIFEITLWLLKKFSEKVETEKKEHFRGAVR
jgi:hypothetical protein